MSEVRAGCPPAVPGVPGWIADPNAIVWGVAVWLPVQLLDPLAHVSERPVPWLGAAGIALVAVCYLAAAVVGLRAPFTRRRRTVANALVATTAGTAFALVAQQPETPSLLLLAVIAVAVVPERNALPLVLLTAAAGAGLVALAGRPEIAVGVAVMSSFAGFGTWCFGQLFRTVGELARTREELARSAVAQERLRFSRDLHDLLGHTLSVIVVKAQAVRRLAAVDPAATAAHGTDIERIGREALTEVRQAVSGYRGAGLAGELERARTALDAAGVRSAFTVPDEDLPGEVEALLGWVLREGVTNVVRHAGAENCAVTLTRVGDRARLEVVDDGTARPGAGAPREQEGRGGLEGLRQRAEAAGGRLEAGAMAAGGWCLAVEVPCPVAALPAGDAVVGDAVTAGA